MLKIQLFFLFWLTLNGLMAQESVNRFKEKTIGVYVSKKNLKIAPSMYQLMGSFIRYQDTVGLSEENLQLGLSIKLGEFLTNIITQELKADSTYFINAVPNLGGRFIKAYGSGKLSFTGLNLPPSTDYVLVVESAYFFSEQKKSVATYSKHMFTQKRTIKKADVYLRLFNVQSGKLTGETIVAFDDENSRSENQLWDWSKFPTAGEQFTAKVFNLSLFLLFATLND